MTDPQLLNDNQNTRHYHIKSCNGDDRNTFIDNNDDTSNEHDQQNEEHKYLHKKFKKIATSIVTTISQEPEITTLFGDAFTPDVSIQSTKDRSSFHDVESACFSDSVNNHKLGYICPHCKLTCNKPSVLQKHMRAHTNERPYPCVPCGFAFKTKSNLYKHCRSRSHAVKLENNDSFKVTRASSQNSEDSDVSLSDGLSNDIVTPFLQLNNRLIPPLESVSFQTSIGNHHSSSNHPACFKFFSPTGNDSKKSNEQNDDINKGIETTKIYKPKFHTAMHKCIITEVEANISNKEHVLHHIQSTVTYDKTVPETLDPVIHQIISKKPQYIDSGIIEPSELDGKVVRNRINTVADSVICSNCGMIREKLEKSETESCFTCEKHKKFTSVEFKSIRESNPKLRPTSKFKLENEVGRKYDHSTAEQPLSSPGPLLGNTRLVDSQNSQETMKRPRLEIFSNSRYTDDLTICSESNTMQMFGGEVQILEKDEKKNVRVGLLSRVVSPDISSKYCINSSPELENASIVVRSSLHSGGTMLHKSIQTSSASPQLHRSQTGINLIDVTPNIMPLIITPNVACLSHLRTSDIEYLDRPISNIPGIPNPQGFQILPKCIVSVSPNSDNNSMLTTSHSETQLTVFNENTNMKFLRPTFLSLKPGTFTPKCHHGITSTNHTLSLISPETPRPEKSYGQLYLNGHAYTYLGLKCSTRSFYCTINRPQPMYVMQKNSLSMYSNWKICLDAPPGYELSHYDSRHRPSGYTLASSYHKDILTHSSQRPCTPTSTDSGSESDGQGKNRRIKVCDGGFESNEDYTYIRGRGRGRYVCEGCGMRCKKPSMLKKHIRTHTDVRPFTCKYCSFSFKTKGNLTKHMKSKAHYKKCFKLGTLSIPTTVYDINIDKETSDRLTSTGAVTDDISSSEVDSDDHEDSEESGREEHEAAQGLLSLACPRSMKLPGLLSINRPTTYPYSLSVKASKCEYFGRPTSPLEREGQIMRSPENSSSSVFSQIDQSTAVSESRLSVIHLCRKNDQKSTPIDLTFRQSHSKQINNQAASIDILVPQPVLLQSIVHAMEHLPNQDLDWLEKPVSTDDQMFQAYLTERHLMDNKLKNQYRIIDNASDGLNKKYGEYENKNIKSTSFVNLSARSVFSIEQSENRDIHSLNDCSSEFDMPVSESTLLKDKPASDLAIKISNSYFPSEFKLNSEDAYLDSTVSGILKDQPIKCKIIKNRGFQEAYQDRHNTDSLQLPSTNTSNYLSLTENSRNVCSICNKIFSKPSQLRLHINIHYFERPFRCESCGTSFRTKGHLTKHERSSLHHNKVNMTSTFGTATANNPRPFKCTDCKSAFRIHGHLAKHLRSKMHIMKLECLRKLPFGMYAEMERSSINLNDIDTTDCVSSLTSLQIMAQKLFAGDPTKLNQWETEVDPYRAISSGDTSSDDEGVNITTSHSIIRCSATDKPENDHGGIDNSSCECQLCSEPMKNVDELQVHRLLEHNIGTVNFTTAIAPLRQDEKLEEKENTQDFIVRKKCIK